MSKTYTTNSDAMSIIETLLRKNYPEVAKAKVTFEVLECSGGLKHHGYPAAATVKANSLEDRVAGSADARIVLNAEYWDKANEKDRRSLIDHELCHIELVKDKQGQVKTDDANRPRFKMRLHDFEHGGFFEIVERHGEYAIEAQAVVRTSERLRQMEFDWAKAELMAARGSDDTEKSEAA